MRKLQGVVIGSVVLDEFWGVVSRLLRIGSERVGSWGGEEDRG